MDSIAKDLWPKVFLTGDISQRPDKLLIADCLCAWSLVAIGVKQTEHFGVVMADTSMRLGVSALPEDLIEYLETMEVQSPNA